MSAKKNNGLPGGIQKGDACTCIAAEARQGETKPPQYYTEATLIEAMVKVHRMVGDEKPKLKKILKESGGLGTQATRDSFPPKLIAMDYLAKLKKGKVEHLKSTDLGRKLIEVAPPEVSDPMTTAQWEVGLAKVESGEVGYDQFMSQAYRTLHELVRLLSNIDFGDLGAGFYPCPECGKGMARRTGKKSGQPFWICDNENQHKDKKLHFFNDDDGSPGAMRGQTSTADIPKATCPTCGGEVVQRESKKKQGFFFWTCESNTNCPSLRDENGKPGEKMKKKGSRSSKKKKA